MQSLDETHKRIVNSDHMHDTLRLQGEARNLRDTLELVDRADKYLAANNK